MKLKFYLRGLGIGIIVTAIILHFALAGKGQEQLSDDDIKQKAAALGMIESTVLKPVSDNTIDNASVSNSVIEEKTDDAIEEPALDDIKDPDNDGSDNDILDNDKSNEVISENEAKDTSDNQKVDSKEEKEVTETASENKADDDNKTDDKTDTADTNCIININAGDSSYVVAKRCADAGLVSSAAEYDMYLCKNGYDKRLVVGVHNISAGASEEEIAKNLTSATR